MVLFVSLIQLYCEAPTNALPTGKTELPRCLDTPLLTALQKTCRKYSLIIYLQCFNRLKGKDAAVLGKQGLMFDEKRFENTRSIIKSLLCPLSPCKPFTKYVRMD